MGKEETKAEELFQAVLTKYEMSWDDDDLKDIAMEFISSNEELQKKWFDFLCQEALTCKIGQAEYMGELMRGE
jgi:hypothetical protein